MRTGPRWALTILLLGACGGPGGEIVILGTHTCFGELKTDVDDLDGDGNKTECIDKGCNMGAPSCDGYDVDDADRDTVTCECT